MASLKDPPAPPPREFFDVNGSCDYSFLKHSLVHVYSKLVELETVLLPILLGLVSVSYL